MKQTTLAMAILTMAAMFATAPSARAVDGTVEINQAKAIALFPPSGFPYIISQSGSYRLTGDLIVTAANTTAISVSAAATNVTIDLNGFSIMGPGGGTTGNGISTNNPITVENGMITGFNDGVSASFKAIVRNVHADGNITYGIFVGSYSVVEGCTASQNMPGTGILCDADGCNISGNTANANTGAACSEGIVCTGSGCVITGNTVNSNSCIGIECRTNGCTVSNNSVNTNTNTGIAAPNATTGYGGNVLNGNGVNVAGPTSMGNNVCSGVKC